MLLPSHAAGKEELGRRWRQEEEQMHAGGVKLDSGGMELGWELAYVLPTAFYAHKVRSTMSSACDNGRRMLWGTTLGHQR